MNTLLVWIVVGWPMYANVPLQVPPLADRESCEKVVEAFTKMVTEKPKLTCVQVAIPQPR